MPQSREPAAVPADTFARLPDPAGADSLDSLVERLRLLKAWAGDPSYETIKDRINAAWTAAGTCGRRCASAGYRVFMAAAAVAR